MFTSPPILRTLLDFIGLGARALASGLQQLQSMGPALVSAGHQLSLLPMFFFQLEHCILTFLNDNHQPTTLFAVDR